MCETGMHKAHAEMKTVENPSLFALSFLGLAQEEGAEERGGGEREGNGCVCTFVSESMLETSQLKH